jgi:hypothetical protein
VTAYSSVKAASICGYGGLGVAGNPNEFGEMIKLQEAENQVIVDYEVDARRPKEK